MRHLFQLTLLSLIPMTLSASSLKSLEPFRWNHRIILYSIDSSHLPALELSLKKEAEGIEDRDLLFINIGDIPAPDLRFHSSLSSPEIDELRDTLKPLSKPVEMILIGKDGGVKKRIDRLDLPDLFQAIDQMPMRQAEIRRSAN